MRILLDGFFDRNFGDDMMIRLVADRLSDCDFYLSLMREELFVPFENSKNIHLLAPGERGDFQARLRVTGSGFAVMGKLGVYYLLSSICHNRKEKARVKSSSVIGCNISDTNTKLSEYLIKKQLRSYNLITVRDRFSLEYIKKYAPKAISAYFPDILFGIPDKWIYPNTGEGALGICTYRRMQVSNMSFYRELARTADDFIEKNNRKAILLAFDVENENELAAAVTIKSLCKRQDMVDIVSHTDGGEAIIKGFSRCESIIAVRFHSSVLAMRMGIKFLPIVYSSKTRNLLKDFSLSSYGIEISDFRASMVKPEAFASYSADADTIAAAHRHIDFFRDNIIGGNTGK